MSAVDSAAGALALADQLRADDPLYAAALTVAQVHATLAVAEELRTANLIALLAAAQAPAAPGQVGPSLTPALAGEIVEDVVRRLGLEVTR